MTRIVWVKNETRTASVQRMIALPQNGSGEQSTVSRLPAQPRQPLRPLPAHPLAIGSLSKLTVPVAVPTQATIPWPTTWVILAASLEECQRQCSRNPRRCRGVEFNSTGRCEIWTRPNGIQSVATVAGFECTQGATSCFSDINLIVPGWPRYCLSR